jgi:hypothetical protein
LGEGGAYVQHASTGINTVKNGLGKFFGRGARDLTVRRFHFGKDGSH